jgi:release factor glutamine methyltransferase
VRSRPTSQRAPWPRKTRSSNPRLALDGGPDGLDVYRAVIAGLSSVVRPGGWALFEVGAGQADAIAALLTQTTATSPRFWRDFGGHTRCVATEIQL